MYGQQHPLPFHTGQGERIVWRFTAWQAAWLGLGLFLAYEIGRLAPLPFSGFWLRYAHALVPLAVCAAFGFVDHQPTGLRLFDYFRSWLAFRRRPRTLIWRREVHEGD
jgi:hypothetical protein